MNKTELVAAMAANAELSKKDAEKALKAFIDVVTDELKKGEKVQLVGFGTFEVSERPAREGINPQTKKKITIIGLGHVSLAAAMQLGHTGYEVNVYKKQFFVNGSTSRFN